MLCASPACITSNPKEGEWNGKDFWQWEKPELLILQYALHIAGLKEFSQFLIQDSQSPLPG